MEVDDQYLQEAMAAAEQERKQMEIDKNPGELEGSSPQRQKDSPSAPADFRSLLDSSELHTIMEGIPMEKVDALLMACLRRKWKDEKDPSNQRMVRFKNENKQSAHYVRVPVAETEESFRKTAGWIDEGLKIASSKSGDVGKSAKRMAKRLQTRHKAAFEEAIDDMGYKVPEPMSAVMQAAMWKVCGLSSKKGRRAANKFLRSHFGDHALAPLYTLDMLCEGSTEITGKKISHAYEEGGIEQIVEWTEKNIARELEAQLSRQLKFEKVPPQTVERLDVVVGGDHGIGAFIAGAKVIVVHKKPEGKHEECFSFEISVAEVICRKDTGDLLAKTIKDTLTKGLREMAESNLTIGGYLDEGELDDVWCKFGADNSNASRPVDSRVRAEPKHLKVTIYITGDLAMYAMVLGKEGMSPHWCHLCQATKEERSDLEKRDWVYWTTERYKEVAGKVAAKNRKSTSSKQHTTMGVKTELWWDFIPIMHYVVPILHCLIGIGDDIMTRFRATVSAEIETLSEEEIDALESLGAATQIVASLKEEMQVFNNSPSLGKRLKSIEGQLKTRRGQLRKLNEYAAIGVPGLENLGTGEDDNSGNDDSDNEQESSAGETTTKGRLEREIAEFEEELKVLAATKKAIKNRQAIASRQRAAIKEKCDELKSARKKSGDGIEAMLFQVLFNQYKVELQAYHGGTMTGKDIMKVMENAHEIFPLFATILKRHGKGVAKGGMSDDDIDALCERTRQLFVLWDGAFSLATTTDPSEGDISNYMRYAEAAVRSHKAYGCSITPKVHLMWAHVSMQMEKLPGGLGMKREDWVERMHQEGKQTRQQHNRHKNITQRAETINNAAFRDSHPEVLACAKNVLGEKARGAREGNLLRADERKMARMKARKEALRQWEDDRRTLVELVAMT